jgi:hypothetical protein
MSWLQKLKWWYADTSALVDTIYDSKVKEFRDKRHEERARKKWIRDNGKNKHQRIV